MDSQIPRQQGQVMGGEEEKPSMLKKMKAKARKMKDTIKAKTSKDQDVVDDNNRTVQGLDEEEDGDEEYEDVVEHTGVHDAVPMHESPQVMSNTAAQKPQDKLEKPVTVAEDSKFRDSQTSPFSQVPEENKDGSFSSSGNFGTSGSESAGNFTIGESGNMGHPKISTETPTAMEEDPRGPKDQPEVPNYQSKVADPTGAGGEQAGISSILQSFNKMNVNDASEPAPISERAPEMYTDSHEDFSPEPIPPTSTVNSYDPEPESKPISERAPEMYSGSHEQFSPEPIPPTSALNSDDPGSVLKSFDADKPEEKTPPDNVSNLPSNQTTYTEKLSYATSVVTDQAIAAKNVVASKLGYGNTEDPIATSPKTPQGGEEEMGKPGYVATMTEKLAPVYEKGSSMVTPVYEKVSSVGGSVLSKVRGTGTNQDGGVEGQDQGVPVKENLAEKLRPSDDDKALSGVISDALSNRKRDVDDVVEEGENQKPAMGTVTESEEVRKRLGSDVDNRQMTETESQVADNVNSPGKGIVESVKGTVTSWFSKGGSPKEASPGTIPEEERSSSATGEGAVGYGQDSVEERKRQESGN